MPLNVRWFADDFGFSRAANESILQCIRAQTLQGVSVLANGLDVAFALKELDAANVLIDVRLHLNLTEGKAVRPHKDIPLITKEDGSFKYTPLQLLLISSFAFGKSRKILYYQIIEEIRAQRELLRKLGYRGVCGVDGHQHVHMVPIIAQALACLHEEEEWHSIRLPKEILFIPERGSDILVIDVFRHLGLNILSVWNRRYLRKLPSSAGAFIGTLLTGRMYGVNVKRALCELARKGIMTVECGTHPGVATVEEAKLWTGDTSWHSHDNRHKELAYMLSRDLRDLITQSQRGGLSRCASTVLQKVRFIVAGIFAASTNFCILYIATEYVHLWYVASAIVAYILATLVSFSLQKFWTFSKTSNAIKVNDFLLFSGNSAIALAFNAYGLWFLVEYVHVWYMTAQAVLVICIACWNYFFFKTYLFKDKEI